MPSTSGDEPLMRVLTGIGGMVDKWLKLQPKGQPPYYHHKSAALALSDRAIRIHGTEKFLTDAYNRIDKNWRDAVKAGESSYSQENWRWKRHLETSAENNSAEVTLERAIVSALGEDWSNQMPTASGLVGPHADKRSCVDLVWRKDPDSYTFFELKVESNTPLYAAIEILLYGLLFVWSRNNQADLKYDTEIQPVLRASKIELCSLAPRKFYSEYNLRNLSDSLNQGLSTFQYRKDLELSFNFVQFDSTINSESEPEKIVAAIDNRRVIWG
jgi:hypothetical protein